MGQPNMKLCNQPAKTKIKGKFEFMNTRPIGCARSSRRINNRPVTCKLFNLVGKLRNIHANLLKIIVKIQPVERSL